MAGNQDSQMVLVLLRLEILDQETIDKVLSLQEKAKEEGRELPLAAVLVQEKFLPFAQVERLVAHQKDEPLVCKSCKTETGAKSLNPREPFVCPSCSKPLPETDTAMEAFMTMVAPPSSPAKKGLIGQTIAGCRIDRKIGEGGMGAVYEATDEYLDRKVAVKILPEYHVQQPGFTERFLRESRSAAKVNHPNVVQVMQAGVDGETHYIVMEFVEGKSLEDILEAEGQVPIPRALQYVRDCALGLQAASEQDIIHRDIKPDNIRINPKGVAKVADFGLAKDLEASQKISATGAVMGTPLYMSPEQARGETVSFRSDVYSLGATLYHLIVGRPPFRGPSALVIMEKHTKESPDPLSTSVAECPPEVNELVMKMMAKKPDERFSSYQELVAELDRLLGKSQAGDGAIPVATGRGMPGWLMIPAAVLLGLVAAWALWGRGNDDGPAEETSKASAQAPVSTDEGGGENDPSTDDGSRPEKPAKPETGKGKPDGQVGRDQPKGSGENGEKRPRRPPVRPPKPEGIRFYIKAEGADDVRDKLAEYLGNLGMSVTDDQSAASHIVSVSVKFTGLEHPVEKTAGTQLSLQVKLTDASTKDQIFLQRNDPRLASSFLGSEGLRRSNVIDKALEQIDESLSRKVKKALKSLRKRN